MRAVVQRVARAEVRVGEATVGRVGRGLLVLLGVAVGDGPADADALAEKLRYLRIFPDENGKMNLDISQAGGAALVVSNFTLLADTRQGRRPAFTSAAPPALADELYRRVCDGLRAGGLTVQTGRFGEMMQVELVNEGPVTLVVDTR